VDTVAKDVPTFIESDYQRLK
jgi:hypothetical protein